MASNTTTSYSTTVYDGTTMYRSTENVGMEFEAEGGLSGGMVVSLVYGGSHVLLLLFLAFKIYWQSKHEPLRGKSYNRNSPRDKEIKTENKLSVKHFFYALWKDRGVYSPLLIHIYDTATDVGVLYEWYKLAQIEKNGTNLKSLDMEQFFRTAIGFLIAYRLMLAFGGWIWGTLTVNDNTDCNLCVSMILGFGGFILGALELMVFVAIWEDFKEKKNQKNKNQGAGELQKGCQSSEGVLEALPEVIMQSVFYMRAKNDEILNAASGGGLFILVAFSIAASLLSITSKYIWVDEYMVKDNHKALIIQDKKLRNEQNREWIGRMFCFGAYNISYGYIIRMLWRLAAVTARFVLFALIWVVLGGAFEIVFVPTMVILWYVALFIYAARGNWKGTMELIKEICDDTWGGCCGGFKDFLEAAFLTIFYFLLFWIGGFVLQLGIAGITGGGIYTMRIIENFLIMTVISVFAFSKFDCSYCSDKHERHAPNNLRILSWVIAGWISIIIHLITSLLMIKVIDDNYDFNITTQTEIHWREYQRDKARAQRKQINIIKTIKIIDTVSTEQLLARKDNDEFFLKCVCGDKLMPVKIIDIKSKRCYRCHTDLTDDKNDFVWFCNKKIVKIKRHANGCVLCADCYEFNREQMVLRSDQAIHNKELLTECQIKEIPQCIYCGEQLWLLHGNRCYQTRKNSGCKSCGDYISGERAIWHCIPCAKDSDGYAYGDVKQYDICPKCLDIDPETIPQKIDESKQLIIENNIEKTPKCKKCEMDMLLLHADDCYTESIKVECIYCYRSVQGDELIWHCIKESNVKSDNGYNLCLQCSEKYKTDLERFEEEKERRIKESEQLVIKENINKIPVCICGDKMLLFGDAYDVSEMYRQYHNFRRGDMSCNQCEYRLADRYGQKAWHCINGCTDLHQHGYDLCPSCATRDNQEVYEIKNDGNTETQMAGSIILGKKTNDIELVAVNNNNDDSYDSDDEVLNNDDEKEMEYVTPGGDY